MKNKRFAFWTIILSGMILSACSQPAGGGSAAGDEDRQAPVQEAAAVADLISDHRTSQGLGPLAWSDELGAFAQAFAEDMRDRNFFSHTDPDNNGFPDRLNAAGISYRQARENIGAGHHSADQIVNAWLSSQGHKNNIELSEATHQGVGYAKGGSYGTYWVLVVTEF